MGFVSNLSKHKTSKDYPNRYPTNEDSLGIEIVGSFDSKSDSYEAVKKQQISSLTWLISALQSSLSLSSKHVYRHPEVSYKQASPSQNGAMEINIDLKRHFHSTRRWGNVLIILFLASCSSIPKKPALLDKIYVTETGFENGGEFCSDFSMSIEDVSAFFSRAKIIDQARLHVNFDYLPCYIRGRAMLDGSNVTWEIRTGGTGKLLTPDGQSSVYGCSTCNDLFGGRN